VKNVIAHVTSDKIGYLTVFFLYEVSKWLQSMYTSFCIVCHCSSDILNSMILPSIFIFFTWYL